MGQFFQIWPQILLFQRFRTELLSNNGGHLNTSFKIEMVQKYVQEKKLCLIKIENFLVRMYPAHGVHLDRLWGTME